MKNFASKTFLSILSLTVLLACKKETSVNGTNSKKEVPQHSLSSSKHSIDTTYMEINGVKYLLDDAYCIYPSIFTPGETVFDLHLLNPNDDELFIGSITFGSLADITKLPLGTVSFHELTIPLIKNRFHLIALYYGSGVGSKTIVTSISTPKPNPITGALTISKEPNDEYKIEGAIVIGTTTINVHYLGPIEYYPAW